MRLSKPGFSSIVKVDGSLESLRLQRASQSCPRRGGASGCSVAPVALAKAIVVSDFGPVPMPAATKKPAASRATLTAVEHEKV